MAEDRILQEAIEAIEKGQLSRARDLLTRILRKEPSRADCWLYMSAVVETTKERTFCLENALKYDPENKTAQQGLVMLGKLPPDELELPVRPENERQRDDVKIFEPEPEVKAQKPKQKRSASRQLVPTIVIGLAAIVLVVVGIFGNPFSAGGLGGSSGPPTATFAPMAAAATATRYLSPTPEDELVSNVVLPTPLTISLEETYTPTPVYISTPHPNNEAFTAAMRSLDAENYGVALGLFEQARGILAETNENDRDIQYYIGLIYLKTGEYEDARRQFDIILQEDSAFVPAYLGRAEAILSMRPGAVVSGDLYRTIGIDPEYVDGYLAIAAYRLNRGEAEEALRIIELLLDFDPDNARGLHYMAEAYLALEENELALEAAQRAFELDMTMEENYFTLGQALVLNGFEQEAYGYLELFLRDEDNQENNVALYYMGRALQGFDDHVRALEYFESSYKIRRTLYEMSYYWAVSLVAVGEYDKAIERATVPIQQIGKWFEPYSIEAQAYYYMEDYAEAKETIEEGAEFAKAPGQLAELYYWRGLIYDELGYPMIALRNWESLLELDPEDVPLEYLREAQEHVNPAEPTFTPAFPTPTRVSDAAGLPTATPTP